MLMLPCINGLFESVFNICIFVSSSSISHFSCAFPFLSYTFFPIHCASANPFYPRNFRKHLRMVGSRKVKAQSELFAGICVCVLVWVNEYVNAYVWLCVCCQYVCLISSVYLCNFFLCKYVNMPLLDNNSWCQMNYFQWLQMLQASGKNDENKTIWCTCLMYN